MATIGPSDEMRELALQSKKYSANATRLSNLLESAEEFFQQLPGKVAVETDVGDGTYLRFERTVNKDWAITVLTIEESKWIQYRLTKAPIALKVAGAKQLGELYNRLKSHYEIGNASLEAGLAALEGLPFWTENGVDASDAGGEE